MTDSTQWLRRHHYSEGQGVTKPSTLVYYKGLSSH